MFVCVAELPSHLRIGNTIVETAVKFLISCVLQNRYLFPTSGLLRRFGYVIRVTRSSQSANREYSIFYTFGQILIEINGRDDRVRRHSLSIHGSRHKTARELADAELQRAIQLSLEEAGVTGALSRSGYVPSQPPVISEPPLIAPPSIAVDDEDDPELKAAIEASLREANAPKPSAPLAVDTPRLEDYSSSSPRFSQSQSYPSSTIKPPSLTLPNYDMDPLESDAIMTFSQTVEQVKNQGGRDVSSYPALNQLYDRANGLRPKLVMSLDDTGKRERK
jgi:growth factor-regulated tyrosine kinase substrate